MTSAPTLITDKTDGVAVLQINRPERRNALDAHTYAALTHALRDADQDLSIHAIILTGTRHVFTAGADLAAFQARSGGEGAAISFLHTLSQVQTPILAAVEGHAIGIGLTLLLHCDFVFVAENANLRAPFVNLGLCPEGASSLLLAHFVGQRVASDWLLSGRAITGSEAHRAGLASRLCETGTTLDAAHEQARQLCGQSRDALRLTKKLMRQPLAQAVTATLDEEARHFAERLKTDDAQRAFARFFSAAGSTAKSGAAATGATRSTH